MDSPDCLLLFEYLNEWIFYSSTQIQYSKNSKEQRRSEGGAGRTWRHLLGAANGRKLFFLNARENSDCNFICVCVQEKHIITAAARTYPHQYPGL